MKNSIKQRSGLEQNGNEIITLLDNVLEINNFLCFLIVLEKIIEFVCTAYHTEKEKSKEFLKKNRCGMN